MALFPRITSTVCQIRPTGKKTSPSAHLHPREDIGKDQAELPGYKEERGIQAHAPPFNRLSILPMLSTLLPKNEIPAFGFPSASEDNLQDFGIFQAILAFLPW
ncbi:Hypothetical protein Minf_2236 [Methylacidiphilum infernorum V4]|uniref:Uncharacterized protein n=1 Tax=Methylacidiphilum infernorum (isolate V4) TaxID=481448 RepID=B3DZV5_METI4|nr:Hypothetical protein Minf_2236 [Methylacidiphilum infernorum V4]